MKHVCPFCGEIFEFRKETPSPRQLEILKLCAEGQSSRNIAHALGISDQTVKNHLTAVFKKLNVDGRTRAVVKLMKLGYIK